MPIRMQEDGLADIIKTIYSLEDQAEFVASMSLYDGAAVMADAINKEAKTIKTAPFHYAAVEGATTRLPSPEEKEIVMAAGTGIAKFDKNGAEVNTSVGYRNAGYADLNGKKKPIPLIVNSVNSGTSFMEKQPFFRQAVSRNRGKAQKAIEDKLLKMIEASMNKKNGGT